jgi:hypothetical protein
MAWKWTNVPFIINVSNHIYVIWCGSCDFVLFGR